MTTATKPQQEVVASASTATIGRRRKQPSKGSDTMSLSSFVEKLAGLREHYLHDLQAARDKVKHNFLN